MKYPELYPMSDEDVEMLWESHGISDLELIEMKETDKCIHDANEFGTYDNVTGKCWVCGESKKGTTLT